MHLKHSQLHKREANPLKQLANLARDAVVEDGMVKRQDGDHRHGGGDSGNNGDGDATAVSIVYVTASKTFTGSIVGYTTLGVPAQTTAQDASPTSDSSSEEPTLAPSSQNSAASSSLLGSIAATTDAGQATSPTDSFAAATSTPASVSSSSSNAGLSTGAKAGIAIGVILAVALVAGAAFFAWRRKRDGEDGHQALHDEKSNPFGDSAAAPAPMPSPPAPMPATAQREQVPSAAFFDGPAMSGALGAAGAGAFGATAAHSAHPSPLQEPVNPFAENAMNPSQASLTQSIPIGTDEHTIPPSTSDTEKAALGATIAGAALAARPDGPATMEHNGPTKPVPPFAAAGVAGSPAASTVSLSSTSSAAMAAAAVGGRNEPPVHRVQLDFKGSMGDEMDVRVGELVAIVHEYDDGWVLARRLDRSKQGVCPRSCLSQRPLQPRNRGPPPPGARGPPPPRTASPAPSNRGVPPMRTASPAPSGPPQMRTASPGPGARAASPALNPNLNNWPAKPINASTITPNMNQWPMKPTNAPTGGPGMVQRSMSPGPYGGGPSHGQRPYGPVKRRSNSMGNIVPNRPVVPGFPGADRMTGVGSDDLSLPIQSPSSPVMRKPLPAR